MTFAPGETTKTVPVVVRGDAAAEPNETFQFALSAPHNADLAHGTATATIVNDDAVVTPPVITPPTTPPTTSPATGSAQLVAKTTVVDDWGTGAVTSTALKNAGSAALDDWTIKLKTPLEITNIWNAEIVSHTTGEYVIHSASWNHHIDPGQAISFGFQATGHATAASFDWVI
ncbi:hypothetical protein F6X51_12620 [Methylobacterium planeticum]|uniref:CBM2 domain-containing protein n=1 Tax=Methylobacterium planeticum TaxID=2615211 RepID=A0A6N6MPA0_9HYPH|nr:hypothetical protein F6X51_12620 [Methylobacterium planeticum]